MKGILLLVLAVLGSAVLFDPQDRERPKPSDASAPPPSGLHELWVIPHRSLTPVVKTEEDLRYVAFVMSDGDNIQWLCGNFVHDRSGAK